MDGKGEDNKNYINNNKDEEKDKKENKNEEKGKNNINSNRKQKFKVDVNQSKEEDNEYLYISQQRSYSCRIGEQKSKKFNYNNEEIDNIKRKLKYLKTPQLKPKKSKIIPDPISIGTISFSSKKSKYDILKNENIILSEGEEEESNEYSSDSNSDFPNKKENNNININNNNEINNGENNNNNNNEIENKFNDVKEFNIEEENDEYNEYGNLSIKNIRKNMIQSKRSVLKNIKNDNEIESILSEKYKKIKDIILNNNDNEQEVPKTLFKTIGFSHANINLPILNYLRKNSNSNK